MEIILNRVYLPGGTNGILWLQQHQFCFTIELPWLFNQPNNSCIPEGKYPLKKRYSRRFGWHILIDEVPQRGLILFHPANHAQKELRGCIAPVTSLTGEGKGVDSRTAFIRLRTTVYACLARGEEVYLKIQKQLV